MTTVSKQFIEAQVIGAGALYTAPTLTVGKIQAAMLLNATGSPVACAVYVTAAAGSPAVATQFVDVTIAAGKSYLCPELLNQMVSAGHEIHASGAGVTIAVAGVELSGQ